MSYDDIWREDASKNGWVMPAAAFARLLMTEPSTYIPALVEAMRAVKGQGPAAVVAELVLKEVNR